MSERTYNIGISCIGSGVGQSIINSLRLSRLFFNTIGFGYNPFAFGAYDCDSFDYTPSVYDNDFIDKLITKCRAHKIDLIIPGLDDEVLLYAKNKEEFERNGIKAIYPGEELVTLCRDKERMSNELNKIVDVFVRTFKKDTLIENIKNGQIEFPFIAKPRDGFASRGIEIIRDESDLIKITSNHIIQELAIPNKNDPNYHFYLNQISKNQNPQVSEISIQVVYSPEGDLLGRMYSYNKLNNGVPIEIIPCDSEYIWKIIDKLTPALLGMGLMGPLNIQGRVTEKGLKLFEMNPRFTGITGLRALMGFNEVEACVKEWLGIDKGKNKLRFNYNRFGTRQTADKSIPIERNKQVLSLSKQLNRGLLKKEKTLLITGACGYLGRNLINKIVNNNEFEIWAFDLIKDQTRNLFSDRVSKIIDYEDLSNGNVQMGNIDILLHLGFSRPHHSNQQIAQSIKFTNELFTRAVLNHIPAIINISSQSVYGLESNPPWTEETQIAPQSVYAQAKYSTELFLKSAHELLKTLKYTSLRLGALAGGADGLVEVDFLSKIVRKAYEGKAVNIIGGMQQMERFDIRDAVDAIIRMLNSNPELWKPVYNLSCGETNSLIDIVKISIDLACKHNGGKISEIIIENRDIQMKFGMDSSKFYNDMNWQPKYCINDIIESLIQYFKNEKRKL